jgi:uncharacterized protein YtpQ (UPF0354 family)
LNNFLERAIAYVKGEVPSNAAGNAAAVGDAMLPVIRPLSPGVSICYVVDEPDGLVFVQNHHLDEAKIDRDALHMIGLKNLQKRRTGNLRIEKHGPIYGVILDGNFEASLILLEHMWQKELAYLVDKAFSVAIPARDILAFCDADSAEGVAALGGIIEQMRESGDHFISPNIFRITKRAVAA